MRVPLIIVTGFLGSGKTTLVNRLLAHRAARGATTKLGVIVNELGAVGIDGALLGAEGDKQLARQIELPGGCVCCVLGDDLDRTLLELCADNPDLEAIVLETTGVAEPLPIAWATRRAPVSEQIRLAAVVTLVDASNFVASREVSDAVDAQVAYADVLLVTKSEIAGHHDTEVAVAAAHELAPRAAVRTATTDEHATWLESVLADPEIMPLERPLTEHVHDDKCRHHEQGAAHGIDSVWIDVTGILDLEELSDALTDLPDNYVRIKGILRTIDESVGQTDPCWTVVHRVGLRVSHEPVAAPDFEEGRLVALGPGVAVAALTAAISAARSN